jgi:type IV pilus assembly protein PilE
MKQSRGFSLIELMIVLVIIAIIAAIAVPSYRHYIVRAHRVDAQRTLTDLATREERFFYSKNTYTDQMEDVNGSVGMGTPDYTFAITAPKGGDIATGYLITATATGNQARDDAQCQTFGVDQAGRQTSTGTIDNDPACWGK